MTFRQIQNAIKWSSKVLNYDLDVELLGTSEARVKAIRYLKLINKHEKETGECIGRNTEPLSDNLCAIKYAEL